MNLADLYLKIYNKHNFGNCSKLLNFISQVPIEDFDKLTLDPLVRLWINIINYDTEPLFLNNKYNKKNLSSNDAINDFINSILE